jgi:hypothetical protein
MNVGLVADNSRAWWSAHYLANPDRQHGSCTEVAFVPFCIADNNFLPNITLRAEAVEIRTV